MRRVAFLLRLLGFFLGAAVRSRACRCACQGDGGCHPQLLACHKVDDHPCQRPREYVDQNLGISFSAASSSNAFAAFMYRNSICSVGEQSASWTAGKGFCLVGQGRSQTLFVLLEHMRRLPAARSPRLAVLISVACN